MWRKLFRLLLIDIPNGRREITYVQFRAHVPRHCYSYMGKKCRITYIPTVHVSDTFLPATSSTVTKVYGGTSYTLSIIAP
jgi:hypothetical protein